MAERPNPDTDPNTLADRLDHRATQNAIVRGYGIMPSSRTDDDGLDRAAADGLRQLAALTTAIGDPDELTFIAGRCLDEAMACQQIGGFSETVGVLSRAAVALQCVATAGGCDPEEGSE